MGCLTEELGRHFWRVRKTSFSSDAQPPYLAPLVSHLAASTHHIKHLSWETMASCCQLWRYFLFFSFFLALDLSPSAASTAAATMCLLQFNLEAGVRRQGLGVAGREGRLRWCEAVDAGWQMGTVPSPGDWGNSPANFFSSARLFLSASRSEGKEFEVRPPAFSYVLAPICILISPLAPRSCHLLCMWQRCECFCGGEEELAMKKIALSQTTCMIYVMADRRLIWFYLLGPFSPRRIESNFKAVELFWKVV